MSGAERLVLAREAFAGRQWAVAYEGLASALEAADPESPSTQDLELLATSAYLSGRLDDGVQAMQRAYQGHIRAGDRAAAAKCAFWLGMVLNSNGAFAVGGGWVAREERLLEEIPGDTVDHGYGLVHRMFPHIMTGHWPEALDFAVRITEYGRRFGDPDLLATGLQTQGRILFHVGRVAEGMALLDEAMVGIAAGEVSPLFAGEVYCSMIEACQEIAEFRRVAEWTAALTRWCDEQPGLVPFTGRCAVHRGQVMRTRGAYIEALDELDLARERYRALGNVRHAGLAMVERGAVLRILGRYAEAEAAFNEAVECGEDPQPDLAVMWLEQGRTDAAASAIRRLLAERRDVVGRARLLPAAIQILVAAEAFQEARPLAAELGEIAAEFGCPTVTAMSGVASGSVALAEGEASAALPPLRRALEEWQGVGAPYEAAQTRILIGRALRALGDEESAVREMAAAQRSFSELGALPAAQATDRLIGGPVLPDGLSPRELQVLRLVACGKSNAQIAAELFISEKTVARHLSNIFTKVEVSSRTAAAAYAYDHRLV